MNAPRKTDLDGKAELARIQELESRDDPEALRERSDIMMATAAKAGWLALRLAPEAKNYITCDLITGDEDLAHAVVQVEVRWRSGKTPAEAIGELRREIEGLKANARDQADQHRQEMTAKRGQVWAIMCDAAGAQDTPPPEWPELMKTMKVTLLRNTGPRKS